MTKPAPKPRGCPVKHKMPDPIPDTPENIMRALVNAPPRDPDDWDYLKETDPSE